MYCYAVSSIFWKWGVIDAKRHMDKMCVYKKKMDKISMREMDIRIKVSGIE